MRGIKSEIEAAGARLVFIGNGGTAFARHFKEALVPDCEVLTDPSTASYALLGARRGIWATLSPRSWPASVRAFRGGFRQSRTQGHAFLLGGVAIVDSNGVVRWKYVSRFAGDHPAPAEIVARLQKELRPRS
ncbi:MAG: AhpC/TSA family protein [Candidatus Dormibacteraceae bacterium]